MSDQLVLTTLTQFASYTAPESMNQTLLSDTVHTFVFSIVLLVFGILFASLAGRFLGPEEFGVFQLSRRTITYLFPVLLLGLNTALVREVGVASSPDLKRLLAIAAWWITLPACIVAILISTVFSGTVNELLFGQETNAPSAFGFLLLSTILFTVVYSQHRSFGHIKSANWQLLISMGLAPLGCGIILIWEELSGAELVSLIGLFMLVSLVPSLLIQGWNLLKGSPSETGTASFRAQASVLIYYGLPRAVVPMLIGVIYMIGVIKLNYLEDAQGAGILLAMLFFLRIIDQAVGPIAVVMLPHLSSLIGSTQKTSVVRYADGMIQLLLPIGLCTTGCLFVLREDLIELLYGQQYMEGATALAIIACSALPVLFFSLAQTILDALAKKAWTAMAVLVGSVISMFGILGQSELTPEIVAMVFAISMWVVAGIMFVTLMILTKIHTTLRDVSDSLLLATIVTLGVWGANILFHNYETPVWVNFTVSVLLGLGIFVITSILLKFKWLKVLDTLNKT